MFRVNVFKRIINHCRYEVLSKNYEKNCYIQFFRCTSGQQSYQYVKVSSLTSNTEHDADIHSNSKEKDFLVRLKNDPDQFGSRHETEILDEGDLQEEKYFTEQPSPSQKLSTKQYGDIIKKLIADRKIKEAIDVLEVRMLKEDRVKPENYIFNLILGACGRVGYTKKAFKLYNDMKKRGLTITGGTYTALFNACSNSPWPTTDGLTRAKHLYDIIIEKGYNPNDTNYNAMIKAFGRCGDLPMAFTIVDEMYSKGFAVKDDTINFLLQACISDKEAGFRHALLVWRKLIEKRIRPSIFTYNLMLRSIRDCGMGNIEITQDAINRILPKNKQSGVNQTKLLESTDKLLITAGNTVEESDRNTENKLRSDTLVEHQINKECQLENKEKLKPLDLRPNLMADVPHLGSLISLSEITKPEERLLLVGGCKSFLQNMKQHDCTPDIKTFTQLLDSIPNTDAAENELLGSMKKLKIKPDVDFYNMLIKKRSLRFDYEGAKEVLLSMENQKYRPNLMTYGILALGCKTKAEGLDLITEMKEKSYTLNAEILGAMLHQACYHNNFNYVVEIMEICLRENVQPNKKFMEHLANFRKKCRKLLSEKELSRAKEKALWAFKARYKSWLEEVVVDESEDAHPWQQYRQETDGVSKYKWKDTNSRFKQRHSSLFKVKTSPKYKVKK